MGSMNPVPFAVAFRIARLLYKTKVDIGEGHCQEAMRKSFQVDSDGTPTAAADYKDSKHFRPGKDPRKAKYGELLRWSGGAKGAGHVAFSLVGRKKGSGYCLTPGSPANPGRWDVCSLGDIERYWPNLKFVGFDREINGKVIS